jgi:hypothetical protein
MESSFIGYVANSGLSLGPSLTTIPVPKLGLLLSRHDNLVNLLINMHRSLLYDNLLLPDSLSLRLANLHVLQVLSLLTSLTVD